jgi:hypothetical protein
MLSGIAFNGTIFEDECIILFHFSSVFPWKLYTLPSADYNGTILKNATVMYTCGTSNQTME